MTFDLGDLVPLTIDIRDSSGALAAAGAVTLTIGLPDGASVTPAVSNPSLGRYQVDYATVQEGHHTVRWLATGANASAFVDSFDVVPAAAGYIVSLSRAKRKLKIPPASTEFDEDIRDYIESTTIIVERHVKETVVTRTVTEEHAVSHWAWQGAGWGTWQLSLYHRPVRSLTSVQTVDGLLSWNVSDLHVDPETGVITVVRGSPLRGHLRVVLVAGMAVIPAHYHRASLIIIEHLWQTERSQSEAGPYPGAYEDSMEGLRRRGIGYAIPNRALELLGSPPPVVA